MNAKSEWRAPSALPAEVERLIRIRCDPEVPTASVHTVREIAEAAYRAGQEAPAWQPIPPRVALHLACLPANLRELQRGLKEGLFGPSVPLGVRGHSGQQWTNAVMAMSTAEIAIEAAEYLQTLATPPPPTEGAGRER